MQDLTPVFAMHLVAQFPNRPPLVIDHIGGDVSRKKSGSKIKRPTKSGKAVAA